MTFVSSSSFVNRVSRSPPQSLHLWNFSTIHAASPAGESFNPGARLSGLVPWISAYAPSFSIQSSFLSKNACSSREGSLGFWNRCQKGTSVR